MTNEEAIYLLRNTAWIAPTLEPIDEAIEMACEALRKADTPQTDCDDRYAIRTDSGEVVAYACPLGCEQTDCGWGEPK